MRLASRMSQLYWGTSVAVLCGAIVLLLSIFAFVAVRGIPALKPSIFFTVTSGIAGGLANAITGTFLLVTLAVIMVTIVGIGTSIWSVEFASPFGRRVIRFSIDVLSGVPSIVIGYFLYVALVQIAGWGFSLFAGSLALTIFMLPYVTRASDLALSNVPVTLREGAVALGARPATVLLSISFPYAVPGILTGLLVAIGIGLGETAPLIYTAGWSNYMPSLHMTHAPVGYLTYVVWTYISQPFAESHALAYAAAALLMILVFCTNLVARTFLAYAYRDRPTRGL
jgi:phosphate transport system permease protein